MTPPEAVVSARHLPTPVHWCTAREKSGSAMRRGAAIVAGTRRDSSVGSGSTITPGFMTLSGSKTFLTLPNSPMVRCEYMSGSSSLRARPSPCSPDIEPPKPATSRPAASMKSW